MIPKKIHYCWLSGDNFPEIVQKCMKSWQEVMPDYELIIKKRLDELLVHDLFVSVEYHPEIIKEHDTLSLIDSNGAHKEPFTEKPGIGIQAAVIGGTQGHPFLKDCLEWYGKNRFILP